MSILIKDMEMPKSCMNCIFCGFAGANCELALCQITGNAQKHIPYSKMPDCPLVSVPPHGRLIDADELEYHADNVRDPMGRTEKTVMWEKIKAAPTIIPADEGGET